MQVKYHNECPKWIKRLVDAAVLTIGEDPVEIGRALACMPSPNPNQGWLERIKGHALLFKSHGLMVFYGRDEMCWMSVLPFGGMIGRDELVVIHS